ncbi:hypothetical protein L0337_43865 [candidate division KSB1 bacterium]|nr:hypothetical protein [candidate division KSB1 bacterium]
MSVTIKAGALDHFSFSTIGKQIADKDIPAFTITAKDAYDNNVALGDSVFLSDNTGTLTPKKVFISASQSSVTVNNARISKGQQSVVITAKAKTTEKIGMSNAFNVNQIKILTIDTTPATVSRGQQGIQVNMTVLNGGPDDVNLTGAQLSFKLRSNGNSVSPQYTVTPPPSSTIPGNFSTQTLKFLVAISSSATTGQIDINGSVTGNISGDGTLSDTDADSADSWIVQLRPSLSYASGLFPKQVTPGGFFEFQVPVKNIAGAATLELKSDSTTFTFNDSDGDVFTAKLDANRGTQLVGNNTATTLTFRRGQIPNSMAQTSYAPRVRLIGTHNGARLDTSLTLPKELFVGQAPPLQIVEVISSQDNVTRGMDKDWTISLRVQNNTSAAVTLQNTALSFVKLGTGGGPDAAYQITKPTHFENSGTTTLAANATEALVFQIIKTGIITGAMAVFAEVFVNELTDPAESNGTQKSILVQTPARLSVSLQASQDSVTQGQTQPWKVTMRIKNDGESRVEVILNGDSTRTSLASAGHQVLPPSDTVIIPGDSAKTLDFTVIQTNPATSAARVDTIHGQVYAWEINSGIRYFDDTADSGKILITLQPKANVQIDGAELAEVFNGNTVNVGQQFKVRVKVRQTVAGAEKVDSVRVQLSASGQGIVDIPETIRTLTDLTQWLDFEVTANSAGSILFEAGITAAFSANTKDNTVQFATNQASVPANIQQPGELQIGSITTSVSNVRFGRTVPWSISVPIENIGEGTLIIDSSRVTVTIGNAPQNDYKINSPIGTITLAGGQTKTLQYTVTQTGYTGGTATLTAILSVLDKNSNTTSQVSGTGTITVVSSALVKILRTDFPGTINRMPESQIALVDTKQVFSIEVTVENTGLEVVDTAYVSLTHSGNSTLLNSRAKAIKMATNGGTAKAIFKVRAGGAANTETFVAHLDSAVTQQGGASAAVGVAVDSTAVVRIELPAKLQMSLSTNVPNDVLTTSQTFTLRAVVKNLGQAQTDSSGMLEILSNPNFQLLANQTPAIQSFVVGDTVKWQIQAPPQQRPRDTLRVQISPPRSKNSGARVQVEDSVATLVVGTFNSLLQITTTSVMEPLGAQDRVISTEQFFTIKSQISASNDLTNKTVTLTLPDGYGFGSGQDSTKAIPDSGTVYWEVQAPTDAEPNSVDLKVTAKARDGQEQPKQSQDTLAITTKRRAILNLTPGISEPAGARNGVLSAGQAFTLSAILANTGEANLGDTATVALDLGNTGISLLASPIRTVVFTPESQVKTITWPAAAPNQPRSASDIIFRITRLPLDENTNKAAPPVKNPVTFNLTTVARGSIAIGNLRIVSPPGARDNVLSTDQDFVVSDSIFWTNATQIDAKLSLPTDFSTDIETQSLTNVPAKGSAKLSWRVRAPGEKVQSAELKLVVTAMDAHNDISALAPAAANVLVNVQQRADPRLRAFISNPSAATDGVVSVGQPFEVTAVIENNGQALLSGDATVSIELPRLVGYRMADGQDIVQTSDSGKFTWWVQARPTISAQTDFIEFNLVKAPRDTNTNQLAASTQTAFQLAVRTEAKTLLAEKVGRTGGPTFRGQTNLPLLRIKLTNPGGPGSSNLVLRKLLVTLRDRGNTVVPSYQALKAIRVVDDAKRDTLYGELTGIVTADPLAVNFAKTVVIKPGAPDTIAILGDIADNAEAGNFRVAFDSSFDFEVVDQDSGSVVIVQDKDGHSGPGFNLDSDLAVLFDSEPQRSFYNYPNPLKPGNNNTRGEGTHFIYNLPEASAGELKIFTLLGELVWETSFSANDPAGRAGGHKLDLFWNGYNGANIKVLNGVYIALLKTPKYGTFMTKVAVVK